MTALTSWKVMGWLAQLRKAKPSGGSRCLLSSVSGSSHSGKNYSLLVSCSIFRAPLSMALTLLAWHHLLLHSAEVEWLTRLMNLEAEFFVQPFFLVSFWRETALGSFVFSAFLSYVVSLMINAYCGQRVWFWRSEGKHILSVSSATNKGVCVCVSVWWGGGLDAWVCVLVSSCLHPVS